MFKRQMILADSDSAYLERLANYFMEKAPQLELNIFTDKQLLKKYLENAKDDILVADETFIDPDIRISSSISTCLALSASMNPVPGFICIRKYQKTETLLNEILLRYAEETDSADLLQGSSHTKTAVFYSPAGGTGKTVLALGMAAAASAAGLKALYLNLEEIDSVKDVLGETPGNLSDVFLALKTKGMNAGIKLASCVGKETSGGFYYLSGVDSISEYEEISGKDLSGLLEILRSQAEYDMVIVDISSGFHEKTVKIMEVSDVIFVPVTPEETAKNKMIRFLLEAELHEIYHRSFQKMCLIANQTSDAAYGELLPKNGRGIQIPCIASFPYSELWKKKSTVIRSGTSLYQMYQPLVERLVNGDSHD